MTPDFARPDTARHPADSYYPHVPEQTSVCSDTTPARDGLDEAAVDNADSPVADWRQRRLLVHLAALREPLHDLELSNRDHTVLARLADQDAVDVGAIVSLFTRVRAAGPG